MPIEVLMPALSPTMTEGNLVKWHKQEGDAISSGDVIAEIETDKATMEVESVEDGTLGKILIPEGTENVKVNALIALILESGEAKDTLKDYKATAPVTEITAPPSMQSPEPEPPPSTPVQLPQLQPAPSVSSGTASRVFASPLARRIATNKGIDLSMLMGTGPHGRIIKADVELAPAGGARSTRSTTPTGPLFHDKPVSTMRRVIAQRLTESKQTVPHFYLTIECQIDALLDMRKSINAHMDGVKITVNDFVIKAAALALQDVPEANASYMGQHIRYYNYSDISVAVAIPDGLITPIVKAGNLKPLLTISSEVKALVQKAKDGKLKPEEFQGGSFSVSNLGMYGIQHFGAIVNPPQACILAVGAGLKKPVVSEDGTLKPATVMGCTLSVDHRVVDGKVGSELLQAFKKYIENPALILIEGLS